MSYSLLLHSTNDPPRHLRCLWTAPTQGWRISNLSGVDAALGEVLVSQVFNKPYWGHWNEAGELWLEPPQPPPDTLAAPSLLDNPPPCPSHHLPSSALILPPLHTLVQQISVASSPLFHPPSSTYLEALVCAPVCLPSFNTCQPSWGTSYTARISFKRAPQDIIMPYGWCYINVLSNPRPYKVPINKPAVSSCKSFFIFFSEIE